MYEQTILASNPESDTLASGMTFSKSLNDRVSGSSVQIWDNYKYLEGLPNMIYVCRIINTK